ncbi:uncharacterized protein LOC122994520 [Thunnus albacares]|uniref:uncharacterized protein LOC122994520 n=1 Tax=Thunnus albacares TaxID=8236 RepID=UPI001CF66CA2|nr:uncharacterized protein LOC122994520 [Thunnus albacares]
MGYGDMLMAKSVRKTRFSFSPFRWRHQAAKERRFCILWINRMVNKQVEKRIAELRSEFLLMKRDLRDEWLAELLELIIEMNKDYTDNTKEDKEDEESSSNMLDASGDADTSDIAGDESSQPAKCEQKEPLLISSNVAETSQLMKESAEEESSKSHPKLSFVMGDIRCLEEGSVTADRTKEEEALLIEKQWKEWMDRQEMKVNPKQVEPSDQQSSEKQGEAALPVSEKQMSQNEKTRKEWKIKTYLNDLFSTRTSYKWERFEDED